MKFILICLLGVIIYQSNDARVVISDGLQTASDIIEPNPKSINPFNR